MKSYLFFLVTILGVSSSLFARSHSTMSYKNPQLPIEQRVSDLLSHMTLEEKVGQLLCPLGWEIEVTP